MVYSNSVCCEVIILFFHFKEPFALQSILKINKILLLNSSQVITKYNRNSAIQSNKVDPRGTLTWLLQPGVSGIFSSEFFLKTVKFPWLTELTIAQISPDNS